MNRRHGAKDVSVTEGLGPGDAVLVPSFTFVATTQVVASLGATLVFVDIDKDTFNLDSDDLLKRRSIESAGPSNGP